MKKNLVLIPMLIAAAIFISQCVNKNNAPVQKAAITINPMAMTHKEAADTLLADSAAPIKPLIFKDLNAKDVLTLLKTNRLDSLFVSENNYPVNGFYGKDFYRIEFIFDACTQDKTDPSVYHVKGRDRHKKVITPFEGTFKINKMRYAIDSNLDTSEADGLGLQKIYAADGIFQFDEDKTSAYGGVFKGTMQMEFFKDPFIDGKPQLWFYSQTLPSGGAGYRFDGTWTSYKKADMVKPVIVASDFFRFANTIIKDFSIGEREVEINEQYKHLGWKDIWENEEWWTKAGKPKM